MSWPRITKSECVCGQDFNPDESVAIVKRGGAGKPSLNHKCGKN